MDTMSIAAMSVQMSSAKFSQAVDIATTKKAMNFQENQAAQLIQSLQEANPVQPSFGHKLDVLV